jgi:hypothetical protein
MCTAAWQKKNLFDTIYDPKHNLLVNFSGVTSGGKVLSWLQIASTGARNKSTRDWHWSLYERMDPINLSFVLGGS